MLTSQGQMDNIAKAMDEMVFTYIVKSDLNINDLPGIIDTAMKTKSI